MADHRVIGLRHHETSAAPFPAKRVLVVGETMLPYRFSHWTGLLGVCGGRKIIASVSTKAFSLSPSGVFFFFPRHLFLRSPFVCHVAVKKCLRRGYLLDGSGALGIGRQDVMSPLSESEPAGTSAPLFGQQMWSRLSLSSLNVCWQTSPSRRLHAHKPEIQLLCLGCNEGAGAVLV